MILLVLSPWKAGLALGDAPPPRFENVHYGPDERQVLDFWPAPGREVAAPLVVYIHGGGFVSGDKTKIRGQRILGEFLEAGISVAAINYRFLSPSVVLQDVLGDTALAVQFLRAQSVAWGVDPTRVAAFGTSAGAGSSLWLATHDDMADAASDDPVRRQSTRLTCAGSLSGQFTYNLPRWREVFGEEAYDRFAGRYRDPGLYGLASVTEMESAAGRAALAEVDFYAHISPDDPPCYIAADLPDGAPTSSSEFLHHPLHSRLLYERCRAQGVQVIADIPAFGIVPKSDCPQTLQEFLITQLLTRD